MYDEVSKAREALVDTIAARKLIEGKLQKQKEELATWNARVEKLKANNETVPAEIETQIRKLELSIAEYQAEIMAQGDQERQLRVTISKLENSVGLVPATAVPDSRLADETIDRMEHKILATEAAAELDHHADEEKMRKQEADMALDHELEELKKKMGKQT